MESTREFVERQQRSVYTRGGIWRRSKSYGDLEQGGWRSSGGLAGVMRVARGQRARRGREKDGGGGRGFRRFDESGIAGMRAGGVSRRKVHLFEGIRTGES